MSLTDFEVMNIKEIRTYLGEDLVKVNDLIKDSLKSDISLLDATNATILSHGGKQMRPMLSLMMARACNGGRTTGDTIKFASASELLHNATLLHDDVADGSTMRRGEPTILSLMGAQASVLLGDYWLVKAMENILSADKFSDKVIRLFSKTLSDLAEGEMLQLQKASSSDTTEEDYLRIIYSKTASLFVAACESAAISVEAPEAYVKAARDYAYYLGLAFQIKDDIFDYSDSSQIGKPVGIDLREQKITLPLLGALKKADSDKDTDIRRMVREIVDNPDNEHMIREFVYEQDGVGYAEAKLQEYVLKAVEVLSVLPDSEDRRLLEFLARFVALRTL